MTQVFSSSRCPQMKKESLTALELSERLGMKPNYLLSKLEEKGLIEYDLATEKWHLKRR